MFGESTEIVCNYMEMRQCIYVATYINPNTTKPLSFTLIYRALKFTNISNIICIT